MNDQKPFENDIGAKELIDEYIEIVNNVSPNPNKYTMLQNVFTELLDYVKDNRTYSVDTSEVVWENPQMIQNLLFTSIITLTLLGLSELTQTNLDTVRMNMSRTLYVIFQKTNPETTIDPVFNNYVTTTITSNHADFMNKYSVFRGKSQFTEMNYLTWTNNLLSQYSHDIYMPMYTTFNLIDKLLESVIIRNPFKYEIVQSGYEYYGNNTKIVVPTVVPTNMVGTKKDNIQKQFNTIIATKYEMITMIQSIKNLIDCLIID